VRGLGALEAVEGFFAERLAQLRDVGGAAWVAVVESAGLALRGEGDGICVWCDREDVVRWNGQEGEVWRHCCGCWWCLCLGDSIASSVTMAGMKDDLYVQGRGRAGRETGEEEDKEESEYHLRFFRLDYTEAYSILGLDLWSTELDAIAR